MKIGYARVSTEEQNLDRQLDIQFGMFIYGTSTQKAAMPFSFFLND